MLHLLEDVLGWIAVLVVSIILKFYSIPILDPILSICITGFVLFKIYPNIRNTLRIFLQYSPDDIDIAGIRNVIVKLEKIDDIHDVHLWSIDGTYNIFSCHVVLTDDLSLSEMEEIKKEVKGKLHEYGIEHATLEFEHPSETCLSCEIEE
jgi:cobalt-zinc-cadmium efflux system protein